MAKIIGGIEGGATHSNIILLDSTGKVLASTRGPGTNHMVLGMPETQKRIAEMVNTVKKQANIDLNQPLDALGLSLSGCEQEDSNKELVKGLQVTYPNLAKHYAIGSDTEGSVATTSNVGGITCIAGTGSNTLLINPNGTRVQCGGWGNHFGDEGSAWKISTRAIKYCFDELDNFEKAPYPIDKVWAAVRSHFSIKSQADILEYFYTNFDKANIAALCKKLSELAAKGDKLSQQIFIEAGTHLAKSIAAVAQKAAPELVNREGGLHILCVGSVWLSWDLLKPGFEGWLEENSDIKTMSLLKLTTTMAKGACYMAADAAKLELTRNYSENYTIFYRYDKKSARS